jgi:5-methylcytosine-specific restriction endonuclease McrA
MNSTCPILGKRERNEVDHIVPISLGGIHHETNLQIITRTENRMKGNRYSG